MQRPTHRIALTASFAALAVAAGFVEQIPNIEIITMTIFLCGQLLGAASGGIAGAVAAFLFSTLNPYGLPGPVLLAAQIFSMAMAGIVGGSVKVGSPLSTRSRLTLALCGFLLTVMYDLLTTASFTLLVDLDWRGLVTTVIVGVWFYVVHTVSNTLIFAFILPILIQRLSQLRLFAAVTSTS